MYQYGSDAVEAAVAVPPLLIVEEPCFATSISSAGGGSRNSESYNNGGGSSTPSRYHVEEVEVDDVAGDAIVFCSNGLVILAPLEMASTNLPPYGTSSPVVVFGPPQHLQGLGQQLGTLALSPQHWRLRRLPEHRTALLSSPSSMVAVWMRDSSRAGCPSDDARARAKPVVPPHMEILLCECPILPHGMEAGLTDLMTLPTAAVVGRYSCTPASLRYSAAAYALRTFVWLRQREMTKVDGTPTTSEPATQACMLHHASRCSHRSGAPSTSRLPATSALLLCVSAISVDLVQVDRQYRIDATSRAARHAASWTLLQRFTTRTDHWSYDAVSHVLLSSNAAKPRVLKPLEVAYGIPRRQQRCRSGGGGVEVHQPRSTPSLRVWTKLIVATDITAQVEGLPPSLESVTEWSGGDGGLGPAVPRRFAGSMTSVAGVISLYCHPFLYEVASRERKLMLYNYIPTATASSPPGSAAGATLDEVVLQRRAVADVSLSADPYPGQFVIVAALRLDAFHSIRRYSPSMPTPSLCLQMLDNLLLVHSPVDGHSCIYDVLMGEDAEEEERTGYSGSSGGRHRGTTPSSQGTGSSTQAFPVARHFLILQVASSAGHRQAQWEAGQLRRTASPTERTLTSALQSILPSLAVLSAPDDDTTFTATMPTTVGAAAGGILAHGVSSLLSSTVLDACDASRLRRQGPSVEPLLSIAVQRHTCQRNGSAARAVDEEQERHLGEGWQCCTDYCYCASPSLPVVLNRTMKSIHWIHVNPHAVAAALMSRAPSPTGAELQPLSSTVSAADGVAPAPNASLKRVAAFYCRRYGGGDGVILLLLRRLLSPLLDECHDPGLTHFSCMDTENYQTACDVLRAVVLETSLMERCMIAAQDRGAVELHSNHWLSFGPPQSARSTAAVSCSIPDSSESNSNDDENQEPTLTATQQQLQEVLAEALFGPALRSLQVARRSASSLSQRRVLAVMHQQLEELLLAFVQALYRCGVSLSPLLQGLLVDVMIWTPEVVERPKEEEEEATEKEREVDALQMPSLLYDASTMARHVLCLLAHGIIPSNVKTAQRLLQWCQEAAGEEPPLSSFAPSTTSAATDTLFDAAVQILQRCSTAEAVVEALLLKRHFIDAAAVINTRWMTATMEMSKCRSTVLAILDAAWAALRQVEEQHLMLMEATTTPAAAAGDLKASFRQVVVQRRIYRRTMVLLHRWRAEMTDSATWQVHAVRYHQLCMAVRPGAEEGGRVREGEKALPGMGV